MSTILFNEIVYGPIHSRRMGSSLGVNLLPYDGKLCSFDCLYCECGFNEDFKTSTKIPSREMVRAALEDKLKQLHKDNIPLDVITFAGNGEPTMHPGFLEVIDYTVALRNKYCPKAKITVLTNGLHIVRTKVFEALQKVDNAVLKLDSAIDSTARFIDRPVSSTYSVSGQVEVYKRFNGNFVLQTLFVRGEFESTKIDNATPEEIAAWMEVVKTLRPREVMIYTIDRETPAKQLKKVPIEELRAIAAQVEQLGIKTIVAG